jgi:mannosyltransferase
MALAVPIAVGIVAAAWQLGSKPLWLDETFQAHLVSLPAGRFIVRVLTFEVFGAPYHAILWAWKFAGTNEAMLRLPSALSAVATLPVTFIIARRVLSVGWASVAALLMALNGMWVHYAQEARPYALWMLLASLSTLALLRAVEQPERRLRWLAYVLLTALAGWTHLITGFVVLAHALALAMHSEARRWWRPAAASVVISLMSMVPIAIAITTYNPERWGWMRRPTLDRLWDGLAQLAGGVPDPLAVVVLGSWLVGAVVAIHRWRQDRRRWWSMVVIVGWALLVALGPWLVSHVRLMYAPRYLVAALPALALLLAIGLSSIRPRMAGIALAGLLAVVGLFGVVSWYDRVDRADWRSATQLVVSQGTASDGLAFFSPRTFDGGVMYQYRYYLTQHGEPDRPTIARLPPGDAPLEQRVAAAVTGLDRLWTIGESYGGDSNQRALAVVERDFDLVEAWPLSRLEVRLYARRSEP